MSVIDLATKQPQHPLTDAMPPAGDRRWWRITFDPKRRKDPMVVQLLQSQSGNRRALSSVIGHEFTIADRDAIVEAAATILARVADFEEFTGDIGGEGAYTNDFGYAGAVRR